MNSFEEHLKRLSETYTSNVVERDNRIGELEKMLQEAKESKDILDGKNRELRDRLAEYEKKPKVALVNVHTIQNPLLITGLNNDVTYASESFLKLTGYLIGDVVGKGISDVLDGVDLKVEEAGALGVERLPSRDIVVNAASGAKIPVTLDIFVNMTGDVNPYSGFTLIMEPTDRIHRLGVRLSQLMSRGNYHEVDAGAFAEGKRLTKTGEFLLACIGVYGQNANPKKKTVVVNFDGVDECDKRTLENLTKEHKFLEGRGYQMFVVGIDPGKEIYNCLAQAGFPTDYISREMPKKIQRAK